jgi:ribosomal subunit interface protein
MNLDIHAHGFEMSPSIEQHIRRRLQFACDWARHAVLRVTVKLSDENGPRGGLDKRCTLVASVAGLPELVIEDTRDDLYRAVDCAVDRFSRNLARRLARKRQHAHLRPALAVG